MVKYECFYHKLGVKKTKDTIGYFTPLIEKVISNEEVKAAKEKFLTDGETISKIDSKVIYYNKYCREWKDGDKTFIEYIMGFVSLNQ